MKHVARDLVAAWALVAALILTIALTGWPSASVGGTARGLNIARARSLSVYAPDPRLLVDRDGPLVEPGDEAAQEEFTYPLREAPVRPIC